MSKMITYQPAPINRPYETFSAATREYADQKFSTISGGVYTIRGRRRNSDGTYTSISGYMRGGFIYLAHFQKFRKKTVQTKKRVPKLVNGEMVIERVHKVITPAHWVVKVYRFDLARVISAKQYSRRFDITLE